MGFLTTITFRNDDYKAIKDNPETVSKIISDAQNGVQIRNGRNYDPVGNCANPVIIQKPRHADDTTLYMHAGNTVVDVFEAKSDWAIDTFISEMEYHLKRLKKLKADRKNKI